MVNVIENASIEMLDSESCMLAIMGGKPVRGTPMPPRLAISTLEEQKMLEVLSWYRERGEDPCYQGHFEELYCQKFANFQGGGYADAVATGTASLFVALSALELPKGSEVLVSPITDPGTLSAIILLGLKPKLVDSSSVRNFNINSDKIAERMTQQTTCALIVHAAGQAVEMEPIVKLCQSKGIKILEDCSQSHGAYSGSKKVGNFGDIAAFSTMYRKASTTGPTGGVVFARVEEYYHKALAYADRGKPRWKKGFNDRNPNEFLFPALNLHSNEFACAIGLASLERLPETIELRLNFLRSITKEINKFSEVCHPFSYTEQDSPFYFPIFVDVTKIKCTKVEFAKAIQAEGIGLNPHYQYLVQEWDWVKPYLADDYDCTNARTARDSCFCLYVNEKYGDQEVKDTIAAILKVEQFYRKT